MTIERSASTAIFVSTKKKIRLMYCIVELLMRISIILIQSKNQYIFCINICINKKSLYSGLCITFLTFRYMFGSKKADKAPTPAHMGVKMHGSVTV